MKYYKDNQNNIFAYELDGSQDYLIVDKLPITKEEANLIIESKIDKVANCKFKAKALLAASDWAVLPDVGLKNSAEFITYRGILRGLATQPQESPDFPVEPKAVWE